MEKVNAYYRSIIWANLLAASVGCSYRSENYMAGRSPKGKGVVDQSSNSKPCEFDVSMEKINNLFLEFKQYCACINQHRDSCTLNEITRLYHGFCLKQDKDSKQQHPLISYNEISSVDGTRISEDVMTKLQAPKTLSSMFKLLCYLKAWVQVSSKRFEKLKTKLEELQATVFAISTDKNIQRDIRKKCPSYGNYEKQACSYVNLDDNPVESFSNEFSDYLYLDFVPFWGKKAELFLFHALNTSVAQGKIGREASKEKYQTACKAIEAVYSAGHIQACQNSFTVQFQELMSGSGKNSYSPIKSIKILEKCNLKPIQDMYTCLSTLIDGIEYSDDSNLKEKVIGSLKMFYNIAYSFGITDLISGFSNLILVYSFSIKSHQGRVKLLEELARASVHLLKAQLYLADFIDGNYTNLDQINSKISEFIDRTSDLLEQHKNKSRLYPRRG